MVAVASEAAGIRIYWHQIILGVRAPRVSPQRESTERAIAEATVHFASAPAKFAIAYGELKLRGKKMREKQMKSLKSRPFEYGRLCCQSTTSWYRVRNTGITDQSAPIFDHFSQRNDDLRDDLGFAIPFDEMFRDPRNSMEEEDGKAAGLLASRNVSR